MWSAEKVRFIISVNSLLKRLSLAFNSSSSMVTGWEVGAVSMRKNWDYPATGSKQTANDLISCRHMTYWMTTECLIKGSNFGCEFGLQLDVLLSQQCSFKRPTKDLPHTSLAAFTVRLIKKKKKKDLQHSAFKAFFFLNQPDYAIKPT